MELWTEKYRPKKIEDLVLINKEFGDTLKKIQAKIGESGNELPPVEEK